MWYWVSLLGIAAVLFHFFFACPRRWGGCGHWHWMGSACKASGQRLVVTPQGLRKE
jgi:hypothetical protein